MADEPISSLDPERSREIIQLLRQLSQDSGTTLVTSLHAFEYARNYYERIIGLRQGRILFDAPPLAVSPSMVEELYRTEN